MVGPIPYLPHSTGYILTLATHYPKLLSSPRGDFRSYGLQDWRQSRLSEPRRWSYRADQLRGVERQNRTVLHDPRSCQRFAGYGPSIERGDGWSSFRYPLHRHKQSPWLPRKRQAQLSPRLETPLQGKFGAHAHRVTPRSRRRPQESRFPQPQQTSLLPRKENVRAR